ncbi:MAG: TonB-dependent receptor [Microscillaceae bacterium]|jgi:outer membrane receptor protein involved in Fe transport|nr:TonB-dependent receptor [Microscillaceae bacterium]
MQKKLSQLWILLLLLLPFQLFAQTKLNGKVVDAEGVALAGVTIVVKGTINGTITDKDGSFSFNTAKTPPLILIFSSVGYQSLEQEISSADASISVTLQEQAIVGQEVVISASRFEESLVKAPVTVEKLGIRQFQQSAAICTFDALQNLKGVDLLTQSLGFKSVNVRGFGANNNNRFLQLTDGMDNRSPGLGFGFGNAAGVSDLDIESIEILPGASSALYGPDALQGLQLTRTKSPFEFQGFSASVKLGLNNFGKDNFGPKAFSDVALRYAKRLSDKFAFKVNFSALNGTDFIADNYDDRSTRGRRGFFFNDANSRTTSIAYIPNNNPATNFEYDGVNIYGDDVTNGGSFDFTANNTTNQALVGRRVTRTGYTELDLLQNQGKVFSYRANVALHYKINDKIEAIASWNYGNGNFIRTAGFREYFPDYRRHQAKLELRGDEFFVRAYGTFQKAEGYNLGQLAARLLQIAKPTGTWATDFANAYTNDIVAARNAADNTKFAVGSNDFNRFRNELINTNNNTRIPSAGQNNVPAINGVRLLDNSSMTHFEGMYNFKNFLPKEFEVLTGASYRRFNLESENTIFAVGKAGKIINEYGWYLQASYLVKIAENTTFKPTAALRYDKNQYFKGGLTPRVSGVLSIKNHNFRASWQSAFRNPSPNQILSDGSIGEVGGTQAAMEAAGLYSNPGYTEASVNAYRASVQSAPPGNPNLLVQFVPQPDNFTTEKIRTWEVGYKTQIANKVFVDAFYFGSVYDDFIAAQNIIQPINGQQSDLGNAATSRTYQVNFNNFNEIFVSGFGLGFEWAIDKGYTLSANYANQVGKITLRDNVGNVRNDPFGVPIEKRKMSNPEVSAVGRNFFISPENRYNITFSNAKVTKDFGFALTYRWTDKMWVEQGNTQGDVWLPAWNTVDAQVSLRVPKIKTVVKLGGTNLFNKYYAQGYGLAQIGAMYYVALNFDELFR